MTADDEIALLPASRLQDKLVSRVWRTPASTTASAVVLDLGSAASVDFVALFGCNLSATGSVVVKGSNVNGTGDSSAHLSSTLQTVDPDFRSFVYVLSSPVSARFWRLEISDGTLSYLEAGRLVVGLKFTPTRSFSFGATRGVVRSAETATTTGGQFYADIEFDRETWSLNYRALTKAEIDSNFFELQRRSGQTRDIAICLDLSSDNLSRDTIWGTIANATQVRADEVGIYDFNLDVIERL